MNDDVVDDDDDDDDDDSKSITARVIVIDRKKIYINCIIYKYLPVQLFF
jgi:hypothetical protein